MTAKAGRDTHTHRDGKLYISKVGRMRVCSTENSLYRKTGERVKFRLISKMKMQLCSTLFQSEEGRQQSIPETRPEP